MNRTAPRELSFALIRKFILLESNWQVLVKIPFEVKMLKQHKTERRVPFSLLIVLGVMAYVPSLFGDPIQCGQASLADYLEQGACTIGDYTLKNFTFDSVGTGDANVLSASQIMIDPTGSTRSDISLQFTADGGFHVAEGQTAEYIFHWNLDPFFPSIGGAGIDLGPNDPVNLTGEFCGDGVLTSAPKAQPVLCTGSAPTGIFPGSLLIVGAGEPASQSLKFPTLVTTMDNRLILDLTGPASVDSFGWHAGVTPTPPVPEPSTALFLIPGLMAVAWLRKKRPA